MATEDNEHSAKIRAAIRACDFDAVEHLLTVRPDLLTATSVFGNWLHYAANHGCLEVVEWLVDQGMDGNAIGGVPKQNALAHAASGGHLAVVKYLYERGVVMDTSDPVRNPLFSCIYGTHSDVAEYLLDQGIDFRASYTSESMQDWNALKFAQERGCKEIARMIESRLAGS